MNFYRFILRSFTHYWRSNLLVIIGAAISTMVLTGTLIVGDSMRHSLEQATNLRLGNIEYTFSGSDRYFRSKLAEELHEDLDAKVSAILVQRGVASAQGGKFKLNNIQVLGIDENFGSLAFEEITPAIPPENQAFISENLANRLQLAIGDAFLLRIEKASIVPRNAPFVSNTDNYISMRLSVGNILSDEQLGRFNLNISQTAPFNVLISSQLLNERLEWDNMANTLLFGQGPGEKEILDIIDNHWKLDDMALSIISVNENQNLDIISKRVFIDSITAAKISEAIPGSQKILAYMANSISTAGNSTPYSFVAAGPFSEVLSDNEIIINEWTAHDLGAAKEDTVELAYFSMGPLRNLFEEKYSFTVKEIVPIEGIYSERKLMPELPGLSDAGSCREWEAGVPISLDAIRDKDEDYWDDYRGTPKAFINYEAGIELWQNRFGVCTAIRLPKEINNQLKVEDMIDQAISPSDLGFMLKRVKEEGIQAANGGVDFSELFMGLSFFLLAASIILMSLLFNLHLEKRTSEVGTLKALGYPFRLIRKIFIVEGILITIPGVVIGMGLSVAYNSLIFLALNSVWQDIVLTSILQESVEVATLLTGGAISVFIIGLSVLRNTSKRLKLRSSELQRKIQFSTSQKRTHFYKYGGIGLLILAIALIALDYLSTNPLNTGSYFGIGSALLLGFLLLITFIIGGGKEAREFTDFAFINRSISRNKSRSIRIVILFSLGTFVTISTGLNKKDLYKYSDQLTSGTGGFLLYMETTLPILQDLNNAQIQEEYGIASELNFIQFRKNVGDDASCLNLNRVTAPQILGVAPDQLHGRFSFSTYTDDLNLADPWQSLKSELPGNVLPAILDQTVIQWGLGKKVGDTLVYRNELGKEMYLKIIGGLENSVFQGNVLIDETLFLKHFPSNSGSHVFLVEGDVVQIDDTKDMLNRAFRNDGLELELSADRLARFNQVENTYLSIFLLLGGLAMILGTIGLGISLARNLIDRIQEFGVMRSIGFEKSKVSWIIIKEYLFLLFLGTLTGSIAAIIATLPSVVTGINQNSFKTAIVLVGLILLNGLLWITLISRNFMKRNLVASLRSE